MIIHGMLVIENGEWKEVNFENELTKYYTKQLDCKLQEFLVNNCIKSVSELS